MKCHPSATDEKKNLFFVVYFRIYSILSFDSTQLHESRDFCRRIPRALCVHISPDWKFNDLHRKTADFYVDGKIEIVRSTLASNG